MWLRARGQGFDTATGGSATVRSCYKGPAFRREGGSDEQELKTTTELDRIDSWPALHDELARLGVHLRNNGPPGWAVLKRGLRKLNLLTEGLSLADPDVSNEM